MSYTTLELVARTPLPAPLLEQMYSSMPELAGGIAANPSAPEDIRRRLEFSKLDVDAFQILAAYGPYPVLTLVKVAPASCVEAIVNATFQARRLTPEILEAALRRGPLSMMALSRIFQAIEADTPLRMVLAEYMPVDQVVDWLVADTSVTDTEALTVVSRITALRISENSGMTQLALLTLVRPGLRDFAVASQDTAWISTVSRMSLTVDQQRCVHAATKAATFSNAVPAIRDHPCGYHDTMSPRPRKAAARLAARGLTGLRGRRLNAVFTQVLATYGTPTQSPYLVWQLAELANNPNLTTDQVRVLYEKFDSSLSSLTDVGRYRDTIVSALYERLSDRDKSLTPRPVTTAYWKTSHSVLPHLPLPAPDAPARAYLGDHVIEVGRIFYAYFGHDMSAWQAAFALLPEYVDTPEHLARVCIVAVRTTS